MKLPEIGKRYKSLKSHYLRFGMMPTDDDRYLELPLCKIVDLYCLDAKMHLGDIEYKALMFIDDLMIQEENRKSRTCANNAQVAKQDPWGDLRIKQPAEAKAIDLKDKKVQEALSELKEYLHEVNKVQCMNHLDPLQLRLKAQNLINTLEENKEQELDKSDHEYPHYYLKSDKAPRKCVKCGEIEVEEIKTKDVYKEEHKSIWKPISELPKNSLQQFVICWGGGQKEIVLFDENEDFFTSLDQGNQYCKTELEKYCTLTDFINHQESLEKRIERLEQLIKRDNEKNN